MSILDIIVHHKKKEIEERKKLFPIELLENSIYYKSPTVSLSQYVKRKDKSGVIAEFKRKSPSVPEINLYADVESVSIGYMQGGASALSVLTDSHFFGGSNKDLTVARSFNFCPILRKDFVIDAYQIIEARSIGADAILLIAEILSKSEIDQFVKIAHDLDLEVLLEIHSESHLDKINDKVNLLGVNNRDLKTFNTSIKNSIKIFDQLPSNMLKISESGIHSADDMAELKNCGYDGFLIGQQFMKEADPPSACAKLINDYQKLISENVAL